MGVRDWRKRSDNEDNFNESCRMNVVGGGGEMRRHGGMIK